MHQREKSDIEHVHVIYKQVRRTAWACALLPRPSLPYSHGRHIPICMSYHGPSRAPRVVV